MTSLHWQTSLQNRQCHALCTLGRTSKCDKVLRPICLWSLHMPYVSLQCQHCQLCAFRRNSSNLTHLGQKRSTKFSATRVNMMSWMICTFCLRNVSIILMNIKPWKAYIWCEDILFGIVLHVTEIEHLRRGD